MCRILLLVALTGVGCREAMPPVPPAIELIREGAVPTAVRTGDLDGDGDREIVVTSVVERGQIISEPFLEVFDLRGDRWVRVFDATGNAPPGPPGTPGEMLLADDGFVAQSVPVLELVDFAGDGSPEIVAGITSAGATTGPLELWVLTARAGRLRTEFYEGTDRGGELTVEGDRVRFAFPVYRPDDPGCCPSSLETQTIGLDPVLGRIGILDRKRVSL